MKTGKYIIAIVILYLICSSQNIIAQDSVAIPAPVKKNHKFIPMKATMLAAAFPGLGQIYNRKYWKIPLVYAGFGGVGYGVVFNTKMFNKFTKAYQDFTDKIPETDSYVDVIRSANPETYDPVLHPDTYKPSEASWVKDQLLLRVDYYKKYRDLSFIGIGAWYLFSILDANVDASLSDYDINQNLTLSLAPVQVNMNNFTGIGINLTMKINF